MLCAQGASLGLRGHNHPGALWSDASLLTPMALVLASQVFSPAQSLLESQLLVMSMACVALGLAGIYWIGGFVLVMSACSFNQGGC